jgi:hypothetical protein
MYGMADLNLPWGGDLSLSPTGGIELVAASGMTQQRLIRRLLTNPGDYLEDLTYGAGLGAYVGQPLDIPALTAVVTLQAQAEETVQAVTSVSVTSNLIGSIVATIAYTEKYDPETPQLLTFTVPPAGGSYF